MEITLDTFLHAVVFLSTIQYSSAYCYGYCWYGSWYIWVAVVIIIAIGCGGLGSYLRRRHLRRALRQQQCVTVVSNTTTTTTQAGGRPYVAPMTQGTTYPPGTAPYPQQAQYPLGGDQYQYPHVEMFQPPPYSSVADEKTNNLPPCYQDIEKERYPDNQEPIRQQYGPCNQGYGQGLVNFGASLHEGEGGTSAPLQSGQTPQYNPGQGTGYASNNYGH